MGIKEIFEKWSCKHSWKVHYESRVLVKDFAGQMYGRYTVQTLICKNCGKIKKIKV
jgi:hypothetical protein